MKKLLIVCLMAMAAVFMAGPASAQIELYFDFDGDGVKDTESPPVMPPPGAGTITVDVWATNFPPPASLKGIDFVVHTDAAMVSISNIVVSTSPVFRHASYLGPGAPLAGAGDFQIGCVQTASCPSGATGSIILVSFVLTPLSEGSSTITADTTGGLGALGYTKCEGKTSTGGQTPTAGVATINAFPPSAIPTLTK